MKRLLYILIVIFAFNQVNGQQVRRVKEASKMTATDDTSGVDKTAGKMYVYDDKYWVGHGTGLRQMSTTDLLTDFLDAPVLLSEGGTGTVLADGTAGQVPRSTGLGTVAWSTATYPHTVSANELMYGSGANVFGTLSTLNHALLQTDGSGTPAWWTPTASRVLQTDASGDLSSSAITTTELGYLDNASSEIQAQLDGKMDDLVDDTTPQLGGELDGQGEYLVNVQNIPDLAASGPGLWFDGVDDVITVGDNTRYDNIFDGGSTIACWIYPESSGENSEGYLLSKHDKWIVYVQTGDADNIKLRLYIYHSGTNGYWTTTNAVIPINEWSCIVITYNSDDVGNDPIIYLNGTPIAITEGSAPIGTRESDTGIDMLIGNNTLATRTWDGQIARLHLNNNLLTAAEIKALQGAPIPFKWLKNATDKPGESRNSGSLVIGAEYRITAQDGEDFTADGAADNNVGTEFVATGTNVTLDVNDTVDRLGAFAQYEPDGITSSIWFDKSGNNFNGTISGAIDINRMYPVYGMQHGADDDVGADDAYVLTLDPPAADYQTGMLVTLTVTTANTGTCSLNVNGLGVKTIKTVSGAAPANSDVVATGVAMLVYNGTDFILINPATTCD